MTVLAGHWQLEPHARENVACVQTPLVRCGVRSSIGTVGAASATLELSRRRQLRVRAGLTTGGVTSGVGITRPESNLDHALVVFVLFNCGLRSLLCRITCDCTDFISCFESQYPTRRALQRCTPTAQPRSLSALSNVSDVTSRGTLLAQKCKMPAREAAPPKNLRSSAFRIWLALAMGELVSPRHNAAVILAKLCLGLHSANESATWRQWRHCRVGRFRWTSPRFAYLNSQVSRLGKVMLILQRGQTYDALGAISPAQRIYHCTTFL